MKRDLDLIRKILLWIEEHPGIHRSISSRAIAIEGYDSLTIDYHLRLLQDAGYVNIPTDTKQGRLTFVHYNRLTMKGCDYLDSVRNDGIWQQTKEKLKPIAESAALTVVTEVASTIIKGRLGL